MHVYLLMALENLMLGHPELCGCDREVLADYPVEVQTAVLHECTEYRYFDFPFKIRVKWGLKGIYLILAYGHNLALYEEFGDKVHYSRIILPTSHQLSEAFNEVVQSWRSEKK